jgi:predicted ATPase/DNA-binding SARP family transcriptional activator
MISSLRQKDVKPMNILYNKTYPSLRFPSLMNRLELHLLGPFGATLNGQNLAESITGKLRALLAYLAVEAKPPHHRETLAGLLWSDQPNQKALHSLRQSLSMLRKILADETSSKSVLLLTNDTVQLDLAQDDYLDVRLFTQSMELALITSQRKGGGGRLNVRALQRAVALYRGPFLDQLYISGGPLFDDWVMLQRETLSRQMVEALALQAGYHERRGEYTTAQQILAHLLVIAPWEENAHRERMRLLALDGQWSAAQAQYAACRRYLQNDLGVPPSPETTALFETIRLGESGKHQLAPSVPPARHNLPVSPTHFVGREIELAELHDLMVDPQQRVVTLLGPGGIGKTRLAIEAAREQVGLFSDGVFFVSLASLSDSGALLPAMADALGFTFSNRDAPDGDNGQLTQTDQKNQFIRYLHGKNLLLVLDNCEQLFIKPNPDNIGLLVDILRAAPDILILATSQQRLNLHEEYLYPLDGLIYPRSATIFSQPPESYSAVDLFIRCARRVQHNFTLGDEQQRAVIRICQMLDGLPLGVELAAASLWTRSCSEIANELSQSLGSLSSATINMPERHRSLHGAFEVSWQLLTPEEQVLFSSLSVFYGGFTAEAAQQVADASADQLGALADKSLLRHNEIGRFELHEAIRQFASEKLSDSTMVDPSFGQGLPARHAHYYAGFLAAQREALNGSQQTQAIRWIAADIDNIRNAWEWLVTHDEYAETSCCADSLYQFYNIRSHFIEGIDLFSNAIERFGQQSVNEQCRGMLSARLGALQLRVGDYEKARAALEYSRAIFERSNNSSELAFCLSTLSHLMAQSGDYQASLSLAQEGLALYQRVGMPYGEARTLFVIGKAHYRLGQISDARKMLEASLALGRETGSPRILVGPLNALADVQCHLGDYEAARQLFEEGLAISRALGDQYNTSMVLNNLGTIDQVLGLYESAETLYQQSREICHEIGDQVGEAMALSNLGEVACALQDFSRARIVTQEALRIGRELHDHWTILACLNTLGEIIVEEGNYLAAWDYLTEATRLELETQTLQMLARSLVTLAGVLLKAGQTTLGLQVLSAVLNHPACQEDYLQRGQRWLQEMQLEIPDGRPSLESMASKCLILPKTGLQ